MPRGLGHCAFSRRRCAEDGAKAVEARFEEEMRTYHNRCETEGIVFLPLVVDTFGGWHEKALAAISKLGKQVARAVEMESCVSGWQCYWFGIIQQ